MEFLSDLIAKKVDTLAHVSGQRYLKIDANGLVIGTTNVEETDPTVPSWVKAITSGQPNQWDQAFGWGNHAGLYRPITYVPSWAEITSKPTTLAGYGITDAGLATSDITAVSLTTATLTLTRAAGNLTATVPTWNQSTTGNAATATALQTARTINGTSFNGSANITTANWGTSRTLTIGSTGKAVDGSANISWSLAEIGAAATSHTHPASQITTGTFGAGDYVFPNQLTVTGRIVDVKGQLNTFYNNLGAPMLEELAIIHGQMNNKFRFLVPTQEESTDGITWTASSRASTNVLGDMMRGEGQGTAFSAIPSTTVGGTGFYRLTWNASQTGYIALNKLYVYCSTNGNNVEFKIERKHNTTGWETLTTGTINNWPGHVFCNHSTIWFHPSNASQYSEVRISFRIVSATNTNVFSLYAIEWFGGYPAGMRNVESYDRDKNVFFPAAISGTRLISTVATGTAPLTVSSTTRVANLNVATAGTADAWTTARTLTIGSTGKSVDGSGNVSWSLAEIGAAATSHTHTWGQIDGTFRASVTDTEIIPNTGVYRRSTTLEGFIWHGRLNTGGEAVQLNLGRENGGTLRWRDIGSDAGSYSAWKIAVDTSRTVSAGTGLTGGGDLSANRTISFDTTWGDSRYALALHTHTWSQITDAPTKISLAELNAGTLTTDRLVDAKNLNDWLSGKLSGANGYTEESLTYVASNTFTLAQSNPMAVNVYIHGQRKRPGIDYTITGNQITFLDTLKASFDIKVTYFYSITGVSLSGSGTVNYIPKWSSTTGLSNSILQESGTDLLIGVNTAWHSGNFTPSSYGLTSADITAVELTTSTLTLTRAAGNLTASIPTWNQNTTGSAATLTTARTLTIGGTGKTFNGSANVSWTIAELLTGAQNIQSTGLQTAWGTTSGINTGAFNAVMGTGANATWLISGTSGGVFRAGIQVLDSSGLMRIYVGANHMLFDGTSIGNVSLSGNALTATTLQTARTINGTSFNGSANITTASWGTARTLTIGSTGKSVDGSANVSWTLSEIGAMALYNGNTSVSYDSMSGNGIWRNQGGTNGPIGTTHTTVFQALQSDTNYGFQLSTAGGTTAFYFRSKGTVWTSWSRIYNDDYHPDADKWTTARTITIGSTGKSVDGTANVSWTLGEIGAEATLAAGTTAQYYRGDKSWQTLNTAAVPESGNLYYTDARVRAVVLTGLGAGSNVAITSTDSLLGALANLQNQVTNRAASTHNHDASAINAGILAVARGGTGIGTYTVGNYLRASAASTLEQRTPAQVLSDIGAAAASHTHAASQITAGTFGSGGFVFPSILGITGQSYQSAIINKGNSGTGTVTFNWEDGNIQMVTLTGNCTFAFANPRVTSYQIKIVQDTSGNRSIAWPTGIHWKGKTIPTLTGTAGSVDWVTITYDGSVYSATFSGNHGTP